jgi:alginate O-acetyltransferase complex protein AlgI
LPRQIIATLMVYAASGLWHGARWTFVLWGLLHALLMVLELLLPQHDRSKHRWIWVTLTFFTVTLSWVFFRSNTLEQAFCLLSSLIRPWNLTVAWNQLGLSVMDVIQVVLVLLHLPGLHRLSLSLDSNGKRRSLPDVTYVYYLIVIICAWLLRMENNTASTFIYFQF